MGSKLLKARPPPLLFTLRISVSYLIGGWDNPTLLVPCVPHQHRSLNRAWFTLPPGLSQEQKAQIDILAVGEVKIVCDAECNIYHMASDRGKADLSSYY